MECGCSRCGNEFTVYDADLALLSKLSPVIEQKKYPLPPPKLCPHCRQKRRLCFRNERHLYRRKCDASGKDIISIYSEDKSFPVYSAAEWWSDKWDALQFGGSVDFNRPFFEQFEQLLQRVPTLALMVRHSENCEYNNEMEDCKNCYMCFTTFWGEDFLYCYWTGWGRDCVDCSFSLENELCYECLDCSKCYNSSFLEQCKNVRDSYFSYDCLGCSDCFCCVGLRQKQHYFMNEPLSKADYQQKLKSLLPLSHSVIDTYLPHLEELKLKLPRKNLHLENSEKCVSDYTKNSKNCFYCFDVLDGQDFRYSFDVGMGTDFMDVTQAGPCEMVYELQSGVKTYHCVCCNFVWNSNDCIYCDHCFDCQNCFGCVGLRRKQYCIFNKQYSKTDYTEVTAKIIAHMQQTEDWGEFFPENLAPFTYNETVANQYYPGSRETTEKLGMRWKEELEEKDKTGSASPLSSQPLPETISKVTDSILGQTLYCQESGRPYKIVKSELEFYHKTGLPLPRTCPDQRHTKRLAGRNPRKLWKQNCKKCGDSIYSTYAPKNPEIVYCESCYLAAVY